jgi:hypothetical protein
MEAAKFQEEIRDAAQGVHAAAMARLAEVAAQPNLDPDLALKIVRETKDIAQAMPKDKTDPYANLTVFNITFGSSPGAPVTVEAVPSVEEVIDVFSLPDAAPTSAMSALAGINMEVVEELSAPTPAPSVPPAAASSFDALEDLL